MTQREFERRFNYICHINKMDSRLVYDYLMSLLQHPIFVESYSRFITGSTEPITEIR